MKQAEVLRIKVPRRVTFAEEVLRVAPQIEASEDVPRVDFASRAERTQGGRVRHG